MTFWRKSVGIVWGLVALAAVIATVILGGQQSEGRLALAAQTFDSPISPTDPPTPTPVPASPVVTGVEPAHSATDSPAEVTILGAYFAGVPSVSIADSALAEVTRISSYKLRAVVPAGIEPGIYDVRVCNPDGRCGTLPKGFTVAGSGPILHAVIPRQGHANVPNDIVVRGVNLQPDVEILIGGVHLEDMAWVPGSQHVAAHVRGVLPASLPPGVYDVAAQNPDSPIRDTLREPYIVLDPDGDDLFVGRDDIWTSPVTIRQGAEVTLGANVHRQGGQNPLTADVAFYLGDPAAGGALLGRTTTPLLPAGHSAVKPVSVRWDTTTHAADVSDVAEVYVVVDPDNVIPETTTANNAASRSFTILPPDGDSIPPVVAGLLINRGDVATDTPHVLVELEAFDRGGSGLSTMYLVEREFNSSARRWVITQRTGWIPFEETYTLTLGGRGGTRFVQAWVADGAGNVSEDRNVARIDYMPPIDTLRAGQTRVYRRLLNEGADFTATLETLRGDADLHVWSPDGVQVWISDNPDTETDVVSFVVPQTGDYQIEVHGHQDSAYRLSVTTHRSLHAAMQPTGDKPRPAQPVTAPDSEPEDGRDLPLAPIKSAAMQRYWVAMSMISVSVTESAEIPAQRRFMPLVSYGD